MLHTQRPTMSRDSSIGESSGSASPISTSSSLAGHDAGSISSSNSSNSSRLGVSSLTSAGHSSPVEPIAVIGMSCRLPGTATDVPALWDMLVSGRTAWTPGPGKRFNMDAFRDGTGSKAGTTNTGGAHWLREDIAAFDAAFFGVNPVEAAAMDPQQRLLLEVAYEAFENAGLTKSALWNSNTGVFVGQWSSDYHEIATRDPDRPPLYLVTGTGPAITSSRIAYHFHLRGPCFTLDTGCSSSLVALHQAVHSLRAGETAQCFVGGVNLLLDPQRFAYQSRMKMFSKEGRSFPFDARANGYGRGEGLTGVVLKPLSAALRDGDHVRAVIRNSVLNQDGRTPGITLPSASAQREAILKAYQQAGLELQADYVEAHGTGTKVGDPIELSAIAGALGRGKGSGGRRLAVGSIKGNIGHTEGAAGLAGLIKSVLMLENGFIPPQANFERANPEIPLDAWNLRVHLKGQRQNLRRISVNSFGYGGTNAHVILESASEHLALPPPSLLRLVLHSEPTPPSIPRLFVLSAATPKACQRMCTRLAQYLITRHADSPSSSSHPDRLLAQLSFTLRKRTRLPHAVALVARNVDELVTQLLTTAVRDAPAALQPPQNQDGASTNRTSRIAFIFSGQGAQYAEMGRPLLHRFPAFFQTLERARACLARLGCPWDLVSELCRPKAESRVNEPVLAQPLCTAVQLGLVDLLAGFGVTPAVVVGHSSGEIAAAYASGRLSFADAMAASYFRGLLTGELLAREDAPRGAMLAVGDSAEVVQTHIARIHGQGQEQGEGGHDRVNIACFNSPASVTVSGDEGAIDKLKAALDGEDIFNRKLITSGAAYHSHHMEAIAEKYTASLASLASPRTRPAERSSVVMYSSVTGQKVVDHDEGEGGGRGTALGAAYWVRNLLNPVQFSQAVTHALSDPSLAGIDSLIEIGPHAQLGGPIKQILKALPTHRGSSLAYTSTLQRGTDAEVTLLRVLGWLQIRAHPVRLPDLDSHSSSGSRGNGHSTNEMLMDLPPYPFDHNRTFWHETRLSRDYRHRAHTPHQLLGSLSPDVNPIEPRWRHFVSLKESPWLREHVVQGQIVFPATGYLAMAVEAGVQHVLMQAARAGAGAGVKANAGGGRVRVGAVSFRNVSFGKALVLSDGPDEVEMSLSLRPQARSARESSGVWSEFRVFSVAADGQAWTEHCRGLLHAEEEEGDEKEEGGWWADESDLKRIEARCARDGSTPEFYAVAKKIGLDWRPPFNAVDSIRTGPDACVMTVRLAPDANSWTPGGSETALIHPAVLDALLFHGTCHVAIRGGANSAVVPTFIQQLRIKVGSSSSSTQLQTDDNWLSAVDCTHSDGAPPTYHVIAHAQHDPSPQGMLFQARGVQITRLPGDIASIDDENDSTAHDDKCHALTWVSSMEQPWTAAHRRRMGQAAFTPAEGHGKLNAVLDALALQHIHRVLAEVKAEEIREGSYFARAFEWMQTLADTPYDASLLAEENPENLRPSAWDAVGQAVALVGDQLANILTEKVSALTVLGRDGLLTRLYAEERSRCCQAQMAAWARELGLYSPGLRVLEIGAGTGSATEPLLRAMQGHVARYDFTDVSTGFFVGAAERLRGLVDDGVLEFRVLDIERDPTAQGFDPASYDLVVASNVIHATHRIDETLQNVRAVLKPGGRFVLHEVTKPHAFFNLVWGVFEGWWAGYEEGRKLSPLLTPDAWMERLANAGLVEAERAFVDREDEDGGLMSVFISRAPEETEQTQQTQQLPPIHLLTVGEEHVIAPDQLAAVQTALESYVTVSASSLTAPSPTGDHIIVVLPAIASLLCGDVDAGSFAAFQRWVLGARAVLFVSTEATPEEAQAETETRTEAAPDTGLWSGFVHCLRAECPAIRFVTLQLQLPTPRPGQTDVLDVLARTLPTLLLRSSAFDLDRDNSEAETEFAERDGQLFVPRLVSLPEMDDELRRGSHVTETATESEQQKPTQAQTHTEMTPFLIPGRTMAAELGIPGLLESFRWADDAGVSPVGPDDVRLELRAASMNFKDILIASGQLPGLTEMRNDCSGVVVEVGANMQSRFQPGDRVCALYSRSYTNYPVVHGDCVRVVPDAMSFPEAAALPIVWATVYYSLVDMGRLRRGDKLLVHAGAGAVGQAAIILAQHLGLDPAADIFVTVGSAAKRELLTRRHGIPPAHIFSSRTTAFADGIRRVTDGYGVDVVLNSLSGDVFRESCSLIAPFGRFVEIGRKDLMDDALMPMAFLLRNVTFAYVDLAAIIMQNKTLAGRLLQAVVALAAEGAIRPVTLTTMPIDQIESAFRLVQAGKHVGKVILTVGDDQMVKALTPPPPPPVQAQLHADATYAVVGGFGGVGRAVISWLANHGARNIVALSRSADSVAQDPQHAAFIDELQARGVRVAGKACDITKKEQVEHVMRVMLEDGFPTVRGVVQSAMVLRDTVFENMTASEWNTALAPKVRGSLHLDDVFGPSLDFFFMLSSAIAVGGNVGQSNYSAACSFQDALVRQRLNGGSTTRKCNYYSINISAVTDVGFVAENLAVAEALRKAGIGSLRLADLLAVVNAAVKGEQEPATVAEAGSLGSPRSGCVAGLVPPTTWNSGASPPWMRERRFAHLMHRRERLSRSLQGAAGKGAGAQHGSTSSDGTPDLATSLGRVAGAKEAVEIVQAAILQQLAKLIATPVEMLSAARSLDSYGVDSLVAVELRNWIGAYLRANVQLMVLRGTGSIVELAGIVTRESRLVRVEEV
ncbi:putative polyketide synthase [Chaetomium sp. MPI-SDFR-AT-0129]|nr:putative polyketide synthase [Chaetomium sp. MPI-SDFR-AT-0129]